MKILRNIGLLALSLFLSYLLAMYFGRFYSSLFPNVGGLLSVSQRVGDFLIGLPLSYTFFLVLLFTAFGDKKKWWWIGIGLIPALAFELYFDFAHIYFPVAIGLVAWLLGLAIARGVAMVKKA